MRSSNQHLAPAIVVAVCALATQSAPAQDPQVSACIVCHTRSPAAADEGPLPQILAGSVHKDLECTDCHESVSLEDLDENSPTPHGDSPTHVDCGACHEDEADVYVKHGRLSVESDPQAPTCSQCHGAHRILAPEHEQSLVNPSNLDVTCNRCHTNVDLIKDNPYLRDEPTKLYTGSVHGSGVANGRGVAATCADCHSANDEDGNPTVHRILSATDPESSVYHFNVPATCGRCHPEAMAEYLEGIHGQLAQRGQTDAPVCTRCHGEHRILRVSDLRSPVSAARLAEATCSPCHESVALNERYGIPAGRMKSYVDSYHGHKRKGQDVHVANCASCHGGHRILPHTDTRSPIHPDNLQATCGACHPGITPELAQSPIHSNAETEEYWTGLVASLYVWLIVATIGLMFVHNSAHWLRYVRRRSKANHIVRLNVNEVAQHWLLMLSFTVLAISGFSLRFSDAWWVQLLFGWGGGAGFVFRGPIHRVAALLFVAWAFWHAYYLCTRRGRLWLRDMIVTRRDLADIKNNVLFFLGFRATQPRFGRFSYMEKSEYWALMWGALIMTGTGMFLWFDNYVVEHWHVKKTLLDVLHVIHYYEAWLATLAILVWHLYATVINPQVYPMNPAWWSGKMPRDMYDEEHPEASLPGNPVPGNRTSHAADAREMRNEKTERDQ